MSGDTKALAVRAFSTQIEEEVRARSQSTDNSPVEGCLDTALVELMLEYLEEHGVIPAAELCPHVDGSGRRRCAVSAYSLNEDEDRLDLFLGHFVDGEDDLPSMSVAQVSELAGKVARFFDYAVRADFSRFAQSPEVLEAARRINSSHRQLSQVRAFVLTNAAVRDRHVEDLAIAEIPIRFEVVDIERLYRVSQPAGARQDIEIDFVSLCGRPLSCLEMTPRAPDYDTYLAIFPAELLFDLYERFGQRLFEFNVRSFLQAKGAVNKGIRDTLRDHPDRFMAYNNGLVATADSLEVGLFHGETVISRLTGLQIVNGAQTTASIYRAKKVDRIDLGRVSVAVKITKVAADRLDEFVPLISQYANTQNVIQIADLSANNPFHIALERLSERVWCPGEESRWFYERARGAYSDALQREGSTPAKRRQFKQITPTSQKVTKTELAKYLMAWMQRPQAVSLGAQKNFSIFMAELHEIFPNGWEPDRAFYERCIGQAILFKACERIVRAQKFAAYRANIAVYAYALLSRLCKDTFAFDRVWREQRISDELSAFIGTLVGQVDGAIRQSAGNKNVTEWCKKSGCWDAVRTLRVTMPSRVPIEFAPLNPTGTKEEPLEEGFDGRAEDRNDQLAIDECMRHDAATWARLNFWGVATNGLDFYERGVAHTLSEYAAGKWSRKPSVKQARIGLRVLRRAQDAKVIVS